MRAQPRLELMAGYELAVHAQNPVFVPMYWNKRPKIRPTLPDSFPLHIPVLQNVIQSKRANVRETAQGARTSINGMQLLAKAFLGGSALGIVFGWIFCAIPAHVLALCFAGVILVALVPSLVSLSALFAFLLNGHVGNLFPTKCRVRQAMPERIFHARAAHAGTCPFPMDLSRSTRWATP